MPSLRYLLEAETAILRDRLPALPFFQALQAGSLPRPAIVTYFRVLSIIHAVLERSLNLKLRAQRRAPGSDPSSKTALLVADLDVLDTAGVPSISPAIQQALYYGTEILAHADADPRRLIGILYILEESQNGGVVMKPNFADCLGISEEKLHYVGCYGAATAARWRAFVDALDAMPLLEDQAHAIAQEAVYCCQRLEQICALLYPYGDDDLRHHATSINVEAGDHPMPQDPVEIDLALRAGKAAWEAYPYLDHRFGERGRRFTASDSCWLVAVTRMPVATATKRLNWLRKVLSSRGIPTIILKAHLEAILAALAERFPDQIDLSERYSPFLSAIADERLLLGDEAMTAAVIEQFDRRFCACPGARIPSAAELLLSAWIDDSRCGPGCLAATRNWFIDPARFSPEWIATTETLVVRLDDMAGARS